MNETVFKQNFIGTNQNVIDLSIQKKLIESPRLTLIPAQGFHQSILLSLISPLIHENKKCSFIKNTQTEILREQLDLTEVTINQLLSYWRKTTLIWLIFKISEVDRSPLQPRKKFIPGINTSKSSFKTKSPLGFITISPSDTPCTGILNCVIQKRSFGKGYGTEASKALLKHLFIPKPTSYKILSDPLYSDLEAVVSIVGESKAWQRVLEKLGMTFDGSSLVNGVVTEVYSIKKDEFRELWSIQ